MIEARPQVNTSAEADSASGGEPVLSPMERAIEQEVFGLEMGYGLLVLAEKSKGGDLLERITGACTILPVIWACFYPPLVFETISNLSPMSTIRSPR